MIHSRENISKLPPGWEQAHDYRTNRYYYVDHNTKRTTWLNPNDELIKPKSFNKCVGDQLPYGWEKVVDPIVGTYYIDHISRRNQWENPVSDWVQRHSAHQNLSPSKQSQIVDSDQRTISPNTTDKPDTSYHTSEDIGRSATSLDHPSTSESDNLKSAHSNYSNSIKNSKYDAGLLDIMDNCFGRSSSQSVEV